MTSISDSIVNEWFDALVIADEFKIDSLLASYPDLVYVQRKKLGQYPADLISVATQLLGSSTLGMNGLHLILLTTDDMDSSEDELTNKQDCLNRTYTSHSRKNIIHKLIEMSSVDHLSHYRWGDNNTLLHLASFLGEIEVIALLIRKGCTCQYTNALGLAPIDVAADEPTRHAFRRYIQSKQLRSPQRILPSSSPSSFNTTTTTTTTVSASSNSSSLTKPSPYSVSKRDLPIPPLRTFTSTTTPTTRYNKIVGVNLKPLDDVLNTNLEVTSTSSSYFRFSSVDHTPTNFAKIRSTFASLTQTNPNPPQVPISLFAPHLKPSSMSSSSSSSSSTTTTTSFYEKKHANVHDSALQLDNTQERKIEIKKMNEKEHTQLSSDSLSDHTTSIPTHLPTINPIHEDLSNPNRMKDLENKPDLESQESIPVTSIHSTLPPPCSPPLCSLSNEFQIKGTETHQALPNNEHNEDLNEKIESNSVHDLDSVITKPLHGLQLDTMENSNEPYEQSSTSFNDTTFDSNPMTSIEPSLVVPLAPLPSLSLDLGFDDFQLDLDSVLEVPALNSPPKSNLVPMTSPSIPFPSLSSPSSPTLPSTSTSTVHSTSIPPPSNSFATSLSTVSSTPGYPLIAKSRPTPSFSSTLLVDSNSSIPAIHSPSTNGLPTDPVIAIEASSENFGGIPIPKIQYHPPPLETSQPQQPSPHLPHPHHRKTTSQTCVDESVNASSFSPTSKLFPKTDLSSSTLEPKPMVPMKRVELNRKLETTKLIHPEVIPGRLFLRIEKAIGLDWILSERPMSHLVISLRHEPSQRFFYTKPYLVMSNTIFLQEGMDFAVQLNDPIQVEVRLRYETRPLVASKSFFFPTPKFLRKHKEASPVSKEVRDEVVSKTVLNWMNEPNLAQTLVQLHSSLGAIQLSIAYLFVPYFPLHSTSSLTLNVAHQTLIRLRTQISKVWMEGKLRLSSHASFKLYRFMGWKIIPIIAMNEPNPKTSLIDLTEYQRLERCSETSFRLWNDSLRVHVECTALTPQDTQIWIQHIQEVLRLWPGSTWKPVVDAMLEASSC